jgi:type VI secretion system secreted protein Hcp
MATSAYLKLTDYSNVQLMGPSQVQGHLNEIELIHWSWGTDQVLNIGSQSSGAGAGKVSFQSFSIVKRIDKTTPVLFQCCCSGKPFKDALLTLTQPLGKDAETTNFFTVDLKLVAVKSITYGDAADPTETIEFEAGGAIITFVPHGLDGSLKASVINGWNRVKNIAMSDPSSSIV